MSAQTARAVAQAWRDLNISDQWDGRTHCIEAAKIGRAVFRALGVEARPLPCGLIVSNTLGLQLIEAGVPISEWPPRAWSVGVNPDDRQGGPGWDGHLILEGDGWMADLSARQFARPGLIDIDAWANGIDEGTDLDSPLAMHSDTTHVLIQPRRELAAWRNGSAWRQDPPRDLIDRIVGCVLAVGTSG